MQDFVELIGKERVDLGDARIDARREICGHGDGARQDLIDEFTDEILCAEPLVAALFQHGQFSAEDTAMSRLSLVAQSTAVPAFLLVKVLAPAFYSRQDTRTPVKAALVAVAGNALFTVALMAGLLWGTEAGRAALAAAGGHPLDALGRVRGAHACLARSVSRDCSNFEQAVERVGTHLRVAAGYAAIT